MTVLAARDASWVREGVFCDESFRCPLKARIRFRSQSWPGRKPITYLEFNILIMGTSVPV